MKKLCEKFAWENGKWFFYCVWTGRDDLRGMRCVEFYFYFFVDQIGSNMMLSITQDNLDPNSISISFPDLMLIIFIVSIEGNLNHEISLQKRLPLSFHIQFKCDCIIFLRDEFLYMKGIHTLWLMLSINLGVYIPNKSLFYELVRCIWALKRFLMSFLSFRFFWLPLKAYSFAVNLCHF